MCSMPSVVRANLCNPSILIGLTALGAVAGVYGLSSSTTRHKMNAPIKIFGRGPAFTSLRLHSVETLSPDTKRFRFELPTADAVSGLPLTGSFPYCLCT
jgi:cytochrome-b5 reductase